jgi:hypothetical protein
MADPLFVIRNAICPVGVLVHILLLIAFLKDPLKCFRNSGTYLVCNLAVSDFLVCSLSIIRNAFETSGIHASWSQYGGDFLWLSFPAASFGSIAAISVDRFFMVVYPLQHRIWMGGKVLPAWIACIWLLSFVFPAKKLAFGRGKYDKLVGNVFGLAAILLSSVMYALTYFKMRKQARSIVLEESAGTNSRAHAARILKERRFLTTIIVIACISVVCNVPLLVFIQVGYVLPDGQSASSANEIILIVISSFYYCNYMLNPFIYIARLPNYRKTFYLLFYKKMALCCKRRREVRR